MTKKQVSLRAILAENVRKRMEEMQIPTLRLLSETTSISQSMISAVMNERLDCRLITLEKLADALQTSESALVLRGSRDQPSAEELELLSVTARYRALDTEAKSVVRWILFGKMV